MDTCQSIQTIPTKILGHIKEVKNKITISFHKPNIGFEVVYNLLSWRELLPIFWDNTNVFGVYGFDYRC